MRFIRGESLKVAIDRYHSGELTTEQPMALRQLLRRFIDACNAVAYVHSRGVIHRDLKPQNIMLGPFGETLVVDWGLAKAGVEPKVSDPANDPTTDPAVRSAEDGLAATSAGSVLGTPGYMSPEQASGQHDQVGPASDVFSLGATLYCLLTGRKPFTGTDADGVLAETRSGSFPPPRTVKSNVPVGLDAVCRKALALQKSDRYPSALDLAADVDRWLADEPVSAYRDPLTVRLSRWGRRHRSAVAASFALLITTVVALSVGTGLIWLEQRKTAAQKREADENYELARELSAGGIELIASSEAQFAADPVKHRARKELLVAAARTYRKHVQKQPNDPEIRRQAARIYRYAANVHRLEREYRAAEPLYADAVDLLDGLANQYPEEPSFRLLLSQTLRDQAKVQSSLGKLNEAKESLARAIEIADALAAVDTDNPAYRRALATALLSRSSVQYVRGNYSDAGNDATKAATEFRELASAPQGSHPYDPVLHAAALNLIAITQRETGHPEKAVPIHAEAIKVLDPMTREVRPGLNRADALHYLTSLRLEQSRTWVLTGRRTNAEKNFGLTALQWERLAKSHPEVPDYVEESGVAYYERGRLRAAGWPTQGSANGLRQIPHHS